MSEMQMDLFWVKAKQHESGTASESDLQNLSYNGDGWSHDTDCAVLSLHLQRMLL